MSQVTHEVRLDRPPLARPMIDQGTVANVLLPLLKHLPLNEAMQTGCPSLTIPWSKGPGKNEGRMVFVGPDVKIGEIASFDPHARAFRIESPCHTQQLIIHVADGEAWPVHLDSL